MMRIRRRLAKRGAVLIAVSLLLGLAMIPNIGSEANGGELPNVHVYPALERQAIAYMAGPPFRMQVSETCSNPSYVYVVAYRNGVPGSHWFRFEVRYVGGRVVLVTPPTQVR